LITSLTYNINKNTFNSVRLNRTDYANTSLSRHLIYGKNCIFDLIKINSAVISLKGKPGKWRNVMYIVR
jgi:hypothetical protein